MTLAARSPEDYAARWLLSETTTEERCHVEEREDEGSRGEK